MVEAQSLFKCGRCSGNVSVRATAWRGHGIGVHGAAHYNATAFEEVRPDYHCICPGGPVWARLKYTEFGVECRLEEAYKLWDKQGQPDDVVYLFHPDKQSWCEMDFGDWRTLLQEHWKELIK